jgi:hypothetical protein
LSAAIVPSTAPWPVTATLVSAVPLEALLEYKTASHEELYKLAFDEATKRARCAYVDPKRSSIFERSWMHPTT